jgi:hypothetical protein
MERDPWTSSDDFHGGMRSWPRSAEQTIYRLKLGCAFITSGKNREDVFGMFRARMSRGGEATFHQILSIGPRVLLVGDMEGERFVSVFTVEGGRIVHVQDYESTGAALDTLKRPPS